MRVIIENRMNISQAEFDTLIAIFEKAPFQEIFQLWSRIQENKDLEEEDRVLKKQGERIKELDEQIKQRNKRIKELKINISTYKDKNKEPEVQ